MRVGDPPGVLAFDFSHLINVSGSRRAAFLPVRQSTREGP